MECPLNRYYSLNRLLLSIIGLWPYQSAINAWILRVLTMAILIWFLIAQTAKIYMTELTTDFVLDVLPIIIPHVGIMVKFLNRIVNMNEMKDLLDRIKVDWERTSSQDEIKIMQTYAAATRKMSISFSFYVFIGTSAYIFMTIIPQILDVFLPLNESRSREHPFHVEFFIDDKKYFYVIRFQLYFILAFLMEVILANVIIFVIYMQHASGMFAVLGHRAEQLFDVPSPKARSVRETGEDHRNVLLFIEDHRKVIQFVDVIQSCYSLLIVAEFLVLIILIGITLVQITKFSGTDRPVRSIAYVIGQLIYLFMSSYMGQHLIDTSAQMSMKVYFAKWHNMSIWKQKIMLFIMMRCMRTVSLNLYSVCPVNLENFSAIVQQAISICMLLRHMS
ncbi:odorant receptor 7a-like isoform X2 [Linepithema humile]|uniref:odorant receptor 7a-like isoform X2 n=1 Tax=Linepithema humile TaxID=83485 RepID=UPI00351EEEDC